MARKRKIMVCLATSADAFIARPDDFIDWLDRPRPKNNYGMATFYRSIDTCVLGRKTAPLLGQLWHCARATRQEELRVLATPKKAASSKVNHC
jgi:dihydrofolate reductase